MTEEKQSKSNTPQNSEKKPVNTLMTNIQDTKPTFSGILITKKTFWTQHCKTQKKTQAFKLMTKHNKVNLPPAGSRWQKKNKVRAIHPKTQKKNSSKSADDKRTQHNYLTNLQKKFWTNLPQNSEENFSVYADDKRSRYNKFNQPPTGCWRQRKISKPKHCKDQKKTTANKQMTNTQDTTN